MVFLFFVLAVVFVYLSHQDSKILCGLQRELTAVAKNNTHLMWRLNIAEQSELKGWELYRKAIKELEELKKIGD